jgi:hypothetical protein
VWAYENFVTPVFLGVAPYGYSWPDVAGIFGANFENSGFNMIASISSPGTHLLAVFPHSTINAQFTAAITRVIYVQ